MIRVPPDGPIPCDLAVAGEAPGRGEVEAGRGFVGPSGRVLWGDLDLMNVVANRARETCYVTNVCKEPLPDADWWKLSLFEKEQFTGSLLAELVAVQPKVVLAFGRRAAMALVPSFRTMTTDHGKPELGPGGKFVAMALWHPAAYLRGNTEALGMIAIDLAKVETLLSTPGLIELLQPLPVREPEWVERIGFLTLGERRKSYKCKFCGRPEAATYSGEDLVWRLCRVHAESAAKWAEDHVEVLYEHRAEAMDRALAEKRYRIEARMRAELIGAPQQKES